MCSCTSCKTTDALAGWTYKGERRVPDLKKGGFDRWPRGDPAGKRASEAAYAAHVRHSWHGARKSAEIGPSGAAFYGGGKLAAEVLARTFARQIDCAWVPTEISPAEEKASPDRSEPARPAQACKPAQHFPALDRQREARGIRIQDAEKAR